MMIDVCDVQRITRRCAVLHEHVYGASRASASAVACAYSWLSISALLIYGGACVSTAQVAHHNCRCVCATGSWLCVIQLTNLFVHWHVRCCLARFILDAAGVHCYVWTHSLHNCERQAVFNRVTI